MHVPAEDVGLWQQLRLSQDELRAVSRTGYIICEQRGDERRCRLRFRLASRLRSRCLGKDQERVARTRTALKRLRVEKDNARALTKLLCLGITLFRSITARWTPALEEAGYYFHGRKIRRKRSATRSRDRDIT